MDTIESKIKDIFSKTIITEKDVAIANELIMAWKDRNGWVEASSNPIKAY